jgi:hypothetical protein
MASSLSVIGFAFNVIGFALTVMAYSLSAKANSAESEEGVKRGVERGQPKIFGFTI